MEKHAFSQEEMKALAGWAKMELDRDRLEEARLDMEEALVRLHPLTEAKIRDAEPLIYVQAGGERD